MHFENENENHANGGLHYERGLKLMKESDNERGSRGVPSFSRNQEYVL